MNVGDVGAQIIVSIYDDGAVVDVSAATAIVYHLLSPAGVTKTFNGVVHNGASGQLRYTTALTSDIDEAGDWAIQVAFTLGSWSGRTRERTFEVLGNL